MQYELRQAREQKKSITPDAQQSNQLIKEMKAEIVKLRGDLNSASQEFSAKENVVAEYISHLKADHQHQLESLKKLIQNSDSQQEIQ